MLLKIEGLVDFCFDYTPFVCSTSPFVTPIIRKWLNIGSDIWLERFNLEAEVTICW